MVNNKEKFQGSSKFSVKKKKGTRIHILQDFPNCALCDQPKELVESHIISKFFYNWIKKTSKSDKKRFRTFDDKIQQDGYKLHLLCTECEQKLGRFETYFANHIFHPTDKEEHTEFKYDSRLLKFLVSLSWKILNVYLKQREQSYLNFYERHWKDFLNNKIKKIKTLHYLIPSYPQNVELKDIHHNYLELYLHRSIDFNLEVYSNFEFIYIQVPYYTILSPLRPSFIAGYKSCKITDKGNWELNSFLVIDTIKFNVLEFIMEKCKALYEEYELDSNLL